MKRLKSDRLSHLAYGETFPTPRQAKARADLEAEQAAEAEETRRGEVIVALLGLLPMRQTCYQRERDGTRYETASGTKTALGLYRTLKRVVETGE